MSNKTISINPSLLSIGGSKTKKNRGNKTKPTVVPLISPSVLKNKLLKRIKEHKQHETRGLANNKPNPNDVGTKDKDIIAFTDEFTDSINYLQTLSKQKKQSADKKSQEELMQRKREELERKTIRHYHDVGPQPSVHIDLPDELSQSIIETPYKINPPTIPQDVPYGVMKGGTKPSYRDWVKTQRNSVVTNPNASLIIQGGVNAQQTARENRLQLLRQKIKTKQQETAVDPLLTGHYIKPLTNLSILSPTLIQPSLQQPPTQMSEPATASSTAPSTAPSTASSTASSTAPSTQTGGVLIATKHITKKTIKRKYQLGRSATKRTIGVLIKDRGTRKRILTAQKELKRRNINDIKLYLREHNLIKTGSNAPNDVLRKLYESAMLSGEITNNNADILLHNLSKESKEL